MTPSRVQSLTQWLRRYGLVLACYIVLLATMQPYYVADAVGQVDQVLEYTQGGLSAPKLWDFGHILIRPTILLMYRTVWPLKPDWIAMGAREFVAYSMVAFGALSGAIFLILMQAMAARLSGSENIGRGVALTLLTTNAVLNFSQTGNSYIPGLMLLTVATYFAVFELRTRGQAIASGLCLAGAALYWFPYTLLFPAVLWLSWKWGGWNRTVQVCVATACGLASGFMLAIVAAHLYSVQDIVAWYQDSKHGIQPKGSLARLGFGIARTFINMGDEGVLLKRYLLRDPYAGVGIWDVLRLGLAKTAIVYLAFVALVVAAWNRRGPVVLGAVALAVIPISIFAMFLFEAGSAERYLGFLPFMGIAAALVFSKANDAAPWLRNGGRAALLLFAVTAAASNVYVMSRPVQAAVAASAAERIAGLREHAQPGDAVGLIKYSDELMLFAVNFPFHPMNEGERPRFFDVVEISSTRMETWRREFAERTSTVWNSGHDMWVTTRLLQPRPQPEWLWVEGDDARIRWVDFLEFFGQFEIAAKTPGPDGFWMLARSERNRALIDSLRTEVPAR